jgi:hypothetical protein
MKLSFLFVSASLLVLAGCASPQAARIDRNPELFASFPLEAQDLIRQGSIDLGFTPEMVRMALGQPERRYVRRSIDGDGETWVYRGARHSVTPLGFTTPWAYRHWGPHWPAYYGPAWMPLEFEEASEDRLRVEFSRGEVSAFEVGRRR